jgi:hypothetical protein
MQLPFFHSSSNYEILPNITLDSPSINSHLHEEQNLSTPHFSNGQERHFSTSSINYTLNSNSFSNIENNPYAANNF